ncbi:MAG: hypothetical protein ACK56I_30635, partial [bacterium]
VLLGRGLDGHGETQSRNRGGLCHRQHYFRHRTVCHRQSARCSGWPVGDVWAQAPQRHWLQNHDGGDGVLPHEGLRHERQRCAVWLLAAWSHDVELHTTCGLDHGCDWPAAHARHRRDAGCDSTRHHDVRV